VRPLECTAVRAYRGIGVPDRKRTKGEPWRIRHITPILWSTHQSTGTFTTTTTTARMASRSRPNTVKSGPAVSPCAGAASPPLDVRLPDLQLRKRTGLMPTPGIGTVKGWAAIASVMWPWSVLAGSLVAGTLALGCSSAPSSTPRSAHSPRTPGALRAQVTSVTATLLPYNPELSSHGIPAEQVNFTVSEIAVSSAPSSFRCNIEVFHSGRQVGATSVSTGAPSGYSISSQSVSVEVNGDNFAGKYSDAHVNCQVS
jgi:hypothetical protein